MKIQTIVLLVATLGLLSCGGNQPGGHGPSVISDLTAATPQEILQTFMATDDSDGEEEDDDEDEEPVTPETFRAIKIFDTLYKKAGGQYVPNQTPAPRDLKVLGDYVQSRPHYRGKSEASPQLLVDTRADVVVVNLGRPVIETTKSGKTRVDASLIRAVFANVVKRYLGGLDQFAAAKSVLEAEFAAKGKLKTSSKNVQLFAMLEMDMSSTFEFMVTHEIGHVELGHFKTLEGSSGDTRCRAIQRAELEADAFAVKKSTATEMIHFYVWGKTVGTPSGSPADDRMFLGMVQRQFGAVAALSELREIHGGRAGAGACSYPPVSQRIDNIAATIESDCAARVKDGAAYCRDVVMSAKRQ